VDEVIVEKFQERIHEFISGYELSDVFNADECALFWRALPDRSKCVKGGSRTGVKKSKDRLTLLLCCSAAGERLKPLIIGKSKKPHCFRKRGVDLSSIGVKWSSNKSAWMTTQIFSDWLKELNKSMIKRNRKILLLVDNCSAHVGASDLSFSNVKVKFLPPNTTSKLQPLDQGVIKSFRDHYRRLYLTHLLSVIEVKADIHIVEEVKGLEVIQALIRMQEAWKRVSAETIQNRFKKAGFAIDVPTDLEP
jgi:hypothetical protein